MSIRKFFSRTANAKQHRRKSEVEARRRNLRTRLLGHETLEDRRLLAVYSNPAAITINDFATTSPYPSTINVTTPSVTASVIDVDATITGYTHTSAADVGMLLSGPTHKVELMRRAGGILGNATNLTYTFSDGSPALNDDTPPSASGTYSPSQYGSAFAYAAPAPAGPFGLTMSEFDGIDPTGTWSLYVEDFLGFDSGTIADGWSLDIQLGGNVVIDAGVDANDGAADTFLVEAVGANTRVLVNGINVFDEPTAGITSLTFAGSGDDDTLTIDYAGGNPVPADGINFDGAGQISGDTLIVNGGAFTTITSNYTNASDGNVDLDGSVIAYTGLEPVLLNVGTVADVIFNLPAGGNPDVVLADDTAANFPGNGVNAANTSAINATTFEYTSFTNPTSSMSVNLGGGGDTMNVNALDPTYAASLIINGGAGLDELQLTGVTLDTGNAGRGLEVNAVDILKITNSTIQNNTVAGDGAGILLTGPSTATIDNSTIADNTATGFSNGGGIYNDGGNLTIHNGSMIRGNEAEDGGGVQNVNGGNVVLDASTVQLNRSNNNGGGVRSLSGSFTIQNGALIDQNTAQDSGGGMSIVGGLLTITDSTVSANQSISGGAGGIFIDTAVTGVISSSSLTDNTASTRGGGVESFGDLTIDGGTILTGNTAGTDGGGLYLRGGPVDITDTLIDNNTASGAAGSNGGGGIFNDALSLALDGTVTISNNLADGAAGSGGGIFNSTGGVLNLTGTIITGNDANRAGGGVEDNSGAGLGVTLTNVTLDNNQALAGPGNGGGLHVSNGGDVLIDGGSVSGNTAAAEGGGLWNSVGVMTITGGAVIANNAASGAPLDQGGGGIFNDGGTLDLDGVTIDLNTANNSPAAGAGILSDGGTTNVINSSITNNDEYGIRIINGSGTILNNLFAGNVTADLVVDGTNAAETFNIDATTVQFGANVITYDGTVADLDIRGLDGDDIFNVSPSVDTQIFVDGGSPTAPATPGDTLNLMLQNEANVYSDKASPPNISITTSVAGMPTQPVTFVSIESFLATPGLGSQTVNFIGDNNNTVDQTDNLVIVGRDVDSGAPPIPGAQPEFQPDADGDNEFTWSLNGSPEFSFRNVVFLNYDSGNLVDTLEITPYADDRPQGWDIDVFYNEGAPAGADGDQVDLLIYHTSAFGGAVSENIIVKPSGPDNGELIVTNASDGSLIVDINYVNNTDIIIDDNDGFLNDTDTLTLLGTDGSTPQTSGDETFVVDFTAAGTLGNNIVNVTDTLSGLLLYGIRDINNIDVVNFDLLDGNDNITILGRFGGGVGGDINIDTVNVFGGAGNDTLTLDNTNGLSDMPGGITYAGGSGQDQLMLIGSTVVDSSTYDIGATADAGTVTHVLGAATQVVHFTGLEPVVDLVFSATLTINANAAANAITYSQSELNPAWGKVSIDGFEPIHFANKTTLVINAAGGGDSIRLNNATLPAGLTGITINGSDASTDSVELLGTATDDAFTYTPSAVDAGVITQAGAIALTYTLNGIDSLTLNGAAQVTADTLTVTTANTTITPSTDPGTGVVAPVTAGGAPLLGLAYHGFENTTVSGTTVVIQGTSEDDTINLSAAGIVTVTNELGFANSVDVSAFTNVVINALGGDDAITINPSALAISVIGGDGSDTLNFNGTGGDVTLDLAAGTILEAGMQAVSYSGIETINLDAGGAVPTLAATDQDDDITVTVWDANSGTLEHGYTMNRLGQPIAAPIVPVVNYTNTNGNAVNVDLAGGEDTLNVGGNALAQTFDVNVATSTVAIDDGPNGIGNDGTVTYTNAESLGVFGLEGDDTFNVTAGAIPVFIDGGDPIGQTAGDQLNVIAGGGGAVFEVGPENDEGGILVGANGRISFDHIESAAVAGAACALIIGTNGDDDITVIARDASTHAGADGVQDFTVSLNAGPAMLFIDTPTLHIDASGGDDNIVLRTPAPNDAAWNVDVFIAGGAPSAGAPHAGDRLVLETPGQDNIVYTPTGSDTGTILIDEDGNGVDSGVDSLITIGGFSVACPGLNYTSDPGGIELFEYDGEGADDSLTIVSPASDDTITHRPGEGMDEGSLRVNTMLAIHYQNLGAAGVLTVADTGGTDTLVVAGTASDDVFDVAATTGAVTLITPSATYLTLNQTQVENLTLDGLDGNDDFVINQSQPYENIDVFAGGPSGSDVLTVVGAAGTDETFEVTPGFDRGDGTVTVTGGGVVAIGYVGVEHVLLHADGGDLDNLIVNDDAADNVWTVDAGPIHGDRIQIDDRESIDFDGFNDVTLENGFGTDRFDIHPTDLVGFGGAFTVNGGGTVNDVLNIIGTPADDVVTSTATVITTNGVGITAGTDLVEVRVLTLAGDDNITLSLALAGVRKVIDGGAGDDVIDVSTMLGATIYGGDGDDNIIGSPFADLIYGGSGNDTIFGLGGDDTIYGGDGDDTIIGGTGDDKLFGGSGSDTFIWNNGDNTDVIEGGDGVDVQIVNGAGAGDDFALSAMQSGRVLFERTNLVPFTISTGGVEQFNVNGLGGGDTFAVNDLTQTDVQIVNLDLGVAADTDAVTIEGRTTDDALRVTHAAGDLAIRGLRYDINVLQSSLVDGDTLEINGNEGNDSIDVADGVHNVSHTTINGGDGDDLLTGWFHIANGGDGDDFIRGAANDQTINGGAGEDTMVGGGGADTFDGGAGFDTILIEGFSTNDRIDVRQDNPTTLRHEVGNTVNGFDGVLGGAGTQTDTLVIGTVEQVRIAAGAGDDIIRVTHADSLVAAANPAHLLRFDVDGGSSGASNRLTVTDDGIGDTTIQRIGKNDGQGSFTMYALSGGATIALPPVLYTNIQYATLDPIGPVTGGTGSDGNGRLFVFKHDPYEQNQSLPTATFLGANSAYNLDPTIDPGWDVDFNTPGDEDWYRVVAETTGTLDFQVYFRQQGVLANGRAGLPGAGNLDIAVYDADGLVAGVPLAIAGTGAFGSNDANDNERVRIPAVAGQTYYLRVVGTAVAAGNNPNTSPAINVYNVSVLNTAPPVPYDIELNDIVQVGTVNNAIAPTTTNFRAGIAPFNGVLVPTDFDYVGKTVEFTAGPNIGRAATITAFNSVTGQFTVGVGLIAAPTLGDTFIIETTDTGRSQLDDRTRDNTPIITFRLDDNIYRNDLPGNPAGGNAPDELIPIPFNASQAAATVAGAGFRVPIFIEGAPQQPGTNPQTPIGYARQLAGVPGVYTFDFGDDAIGGPLMLSDGSHFIRAAVEIIDPSSPTQYGFGTRSVSLEIVVDTKAPLVSFGDPAIVGDGLHPDSDSGDPLVPATLSDGITNDLMPTFFGRAEANANVKLYLDLDGSGTITGPDILIGQTTVMPFDGTNQEPFAPWQITSTVNFNDPSLGLGIDGVRTILVQAEDVEGNRSADDLALRLSVFIDTRGPQVTDVFVTDHEDFNLFALKPETPSPTPRVDSITIRVQDLPNRLTGFLYPAISNLPVAPNVLPLGLITLVGDHSGVIALQSVLFTPDPFPAVIPPGGAPATGSITLRFAEPLPDDRFTLTLDDGIIDPAGNALDGESNAAEPGTPLFPSGDGIPGGDFVARFTVDSRPEVGTWSQGLVYVDINGNHVFDPEGQDNDATNRDFVYQFGRISDGLFAGNFASRGANASGFDKMGAYGLFNGRYSFLLDTDDDGVGDVAESTNIIQVNGSPVAGNFNGNRLDGDEVAVFDGSTWYVYDIVGTGMVLIDTIPTNYTGIPFAGNFNGNAAGDDGFAVYDNLTNTVIFDTNRDGISDGELVLGDSTGRFSGLSGFTDKPVAGDLNLDGVDDIGIWVKGRQGVLPKEQGEFFFWVSDVDKDANGVFVPDANPLANFSADVNFPAGAVPLGTTTFSPAPLGNDLFIQWGDEFALPIFGNFDPPVGDDIDYEFATATNQVNKYDVNNDGRVTALDALILINKLNEGVTEAEPGSRLRLRATVGDLFIDVNGDSKLTAVDVLQVINELNRIDASGEPIKAGSDAGQTDVAWHDAVDSVFANKDDEDETDTAVDDFLGLMF